MKQNWQKLNINYTEKTQIQFFLKLFREQQKHLHRMHNINRTPAA